MQRAGTPVPQSAAGRLRLRRRRRRTETIGRAVDTVSRVHLLARLDNLCNPSFYFFINQRVFDDVCYFFNILFILINIERVDGKMAAT